MYKWRNQNMYTLSFLHFLNNCGTTVYTWGLISLHSTWDAKKHNYKHSWTWESENILNIKYLKQFWKKKKKWIRCAEWPLPFPWSKKKGSVYIHLRQISNLKRNYHACDTKPLLKINVAFHCFFCVFKKSFLTQYLSGPFLWRYPQ